MHSLQKQFKNKKVLVVGLGLQGGGIGLVKFFSKLGAQMRVTDLKSEKQLYESLNKIKELGVRFTLGKHVVEDFLWAEVIFKGPSVPWDLSYIQEAEKKSIPIEMEASFFASYCPCPIIGVTGTRGKSTTSSMIYQLMRDAGLSVFLGGNIPNTSTITLLKKLIPTDYVVLELSSWQLSGFHRKKISPHIAVITNFYPDHLNYYKTMEEYWYDKTALFKYQKKGDTFIIPYFLQDKIYPAPLSTMILTKAEDFKSKLDYLQGKHTYENAIQALAVSRVLQIDQSKAYKSISDMKPLVYRLSKIATILGIDIYNDSTSTTPIACQKAIESLHNKKITLILGGNSKNLPHEKLIDVINTYVEMVIFLKGSFTDEIEPFISKNKRLNIIPFDDINKAFYKAIEVTKKNGVILFSPASTSFAMFENEFHRGRIFTQIVKDYEEKKAE